MAEIRSLPSAVLATLRVRARVSSSDASIDAGDWLLVLNFLRVNGTKPVG
ncbi:MAG: hypothetical protein GY724_26980 [Actinomycetia bacterium]|nr:hypothetical protein [Actinomycetes bacterium]MCP5033549.1 hypothetical protein [Actinomycetes bacterium]